MIPSLVFKNAANTEGVVVIYDKFLNDDGAPVIIWRGTVKGNYQVQNIEQLSGNARTLITQGSYLIPREYIPEQDYAMCGGELTIKGHTYRITDIIPNYDLFGNLNYWRIKTE